MNHALAAALLFIVIGAGAARAQPGPFDAGPDVEDAGPGDADAGPDPCAPTCADADTLAFCDVDEPTTVSCSEVFGADASCGQLGDSADCLLGSGAVCDPDYAGGLSRCGPGLACVLANEEATEPTCGTSGTPGGGAPLEPTAGTFTPTTTTTTSSTSDLFSCLGCSSTSASSAALFGAVLLALRRPRRRR